MPVDASVTGPVRLSGACTLDDADVLLRVLLHQPRRPVDWGSVTSAHTAVIQVLLALQPDIEGSPENPNLRHWIQPLIRGRGIAGG